MTHHDDSMRRHHTQRSNHSNLLHRLPDLMQHQAPSNGSDRPTTCNRRPRRRKHLVAQVTTRNSCTTSRKVCNTRQARRFLQVKSSNMDRNTNHKSPGSKHSNTSNMALVSCTACSKANNKPKQHTTKYQRSDSRAQAPHLRHFPPSLGNHNQLNTTLQEPLCLPAHRLPTSRHLNSLRSIRRPHTRSLALQRNNHMRCLTLRSRPRTRHTTNNRSTLQRNRNISRSRSHRQIPSISCSINTSCQ
jgi:hypothetical protein